MIEAGGSCRAVLDARGMVELALSRGAAAGPPGAVVLLAKP